MGRVPAPRRFQAHPSLCRSEPVVVACGSFRLVQPSSPRLLIMSSIRRSLSGSLARARLASAAAACALSMLDLQGGYDVDCPYALTEIGAARIISDVGRVH